MPGDNQPSIPATVMLAIGALVVVLIVAVVMTAS
jgi:hypothetical protein